MIDCLEYTIDYFDNQEAAWKRVTVVARCKTSALKLVDEVVPLQRRLMYVNDQEKDTTAVEREQKLTTDAYLVVIEPIKKLSSQSAHTSVQAHQQQRPMLRLVGS